jgi:hypothetical protein
MARRKRRNSGNSSGFIILTLLLIAISAVLLAGYVFLRVKAASQVTLDEASLCPEKGPRSVTAVMLDVTDPISTVTATDLKNEFQALVDGIPIGGLLQVYTLTEEEGHLDITFSGCNPGDGQSVDAWTNNPRLVQERWERGFQIPLENISKRLSEGNAGQQSPIMAGIQKINLEAFGSPRYVDLPKTLVIASDMIEHTSSFSMYRSGTAYSNFEDSEAKAKFRTPLNGVNVRILEFQRPDTRFSDEALAEFWNTWVRNNMGRLVSFKRMQGLL